MSVGLAVGWPSIRTVIHLELLLLTTFGCVHLNLFNTVLSAVFVCVRIRETWRSKNNNYTQVLQFSKKAQGKQFKAARM